MSDFAGDGGALRGCSPHSGPSSKSGLGISSVTMVGDRVIASKRREERSSRSDKDRFGEYSKPTTLSSLPTWYSTDCDFDVCRELGPLDPGLDLTGRIRDAGGLGKSRGSRGGGEGSLLFFRIDLLGDGLFEDGGRYMRAFDFLVLANRLF